MKANKYFEKGYLFLLIPMTLLITMSFFRTGYKHLEKRKPSFYLGINGHPLNRGAEYRVIPLKEQMNILVSMKMYNYRIDAKIDQNGDLGFNRDRFDTLLSLATSNQIKILPMLYLYGLNYGDNLDTSFNKGYRIGAGFAEHYKNYIDVYEVGNEQELALLNKRSLPGIDTDDYNMAKFNVVASFMKGMIAGIKEKEPAAKTIINVCETHYGFFKLLKSHNVNFDIIGHHWYFYKPYSISGYDQLIENMSGVFDFQKPILVTEFNHAYGDSQITPEQYKDGVSDFLENISTNPFIAGCYYYELFDEPHQKVTPASAYQRNFGAISVDSNYNLSNKKVVDALSF